MGRRLAMGEKKFENVAVTQNNNNWETLTKRKTNLYGRKDDIRSEFARDYTRVLHSLAYRRLKHKTQVFFNAAGNDHICTRIEHVQHVESVSNTVAKCLGLNEELTRAIAIAHDLGHAPFGHQGESVIQKWTKEHLKKDFWHEQNGVYFVDNVELLEDNQRKLRNLDLTYAVRDGIISHCGEVDENAIRPRTELFDLKKFGKAGEYQAATWEGCVVKLADKIAYLGRDIEDAIRLGYLSEGEMNTLREMAQVHNQEAMNTTVIMHNMIIDLCNNSSVEKGLLLSKTMADQLDAIKKFNQDKIYRNPRLDTFKKYSKLVLNEIFGTLLSFYDNCQGDIMVCLMKMKNDEKKFVNDFAEWIVQYCTLNFKEPTYAWAKKISDNCENKKIYMELSQRTQYIQAVVDFVAGMTDVYAINAFDELLRC